MLYIIGRIVTFEICNMLQLTEAIGFEEVTEKRLKSVIASPITPRAISIAHLEEMTKRRSLLLMLPNPFLQRGEVSSKLLAFSALKKIKKLHNVAKNLAVILYPNQILH